MSIISRIKEEIQVIRERDPAIHSNMEVFLYPSFKVMLYYLGCVAYAGCCLFGDGKAVLLKHSEQIILLLSL